MSPSSAASRRKDFLSVVDFDAADLERDAGFELVRIPSIADAELGWG